MAVANDARPSTSQSWPAILPLHDVVGTRPRVVEDGRSQERRSPKVTLEQLRIFSAVAEREHLTGAAQALRMSQGSVSVQVRRLESALGLPLLHRVGRNVRLTDVGRAVHQQAIEALRSVQSVEDLAAAYRQEDRGEVLVTAGLVIGAHRLSGWLGPFVQAHPRIDVHISIAPLPAAMESLTAGVVDVVVVGAAVQTANIETIALERTELVIVVASRHALAGHPQPLQELWRYRHLAHEHGSATQMQVGALLGHHADLSPTTELEEGALLAALHTGLGFAVMPRAIVEAEIASGSLTVIRGPGEAVPVEFTAVRRSGLQTPVVEAFWKHLQHISAA